MNIAVNSRIYQTSHAGIPYYIDGLYTNLINQYPKDSYEFFQTNEEKKIGNTKTLKMGSVSTLLDSVLFDNFFINNLIKKEQIDIFHGPAHVLPYRKIPGIKYVVTIHDLAFLYFPQYYSRLFNLYYPSILKRTLKNADGIVAVCETTKNDLIKFFSIPEEKITVIYSGIEESFFDTKKYKPLLDKQYIFTVCTHLTRKNILPVLTILKRSKKLKHFDFVIAGKMEAHHIALLEETIQRLNLKKRVHYLGYTSKQDIHSWFRNASFFIYPSFYEGFGFPVVEAMASKVPVITANNSSLQEITLHKEWLVDPYNIDDIQEKMEKIIDLSKKEKKQLIEDNFQFASKFRWKQTAALYHNFFSHI